MTASRSRCLAREISTSWKANRIVQTLRDDIFSLVGPPQKLHSDQAVCPGPFCRASQILSDLCKAFGVKKSRTTPYRPMGDGLVERMNRSLLNLLRSYVDREGDWEEHFQLLLFLYRTTKHATACLSPYEVLFGSNPPSLQIPSLPSSMIPEPSEYSESLKSKLLELREMVDANIVESAERQCQSYRSSETCETKHWAASSTQQPNKGQAGPSMDRSLDHHRLEGALISAVNGHHRAHGAHQLCAPPADRGE